VSFIYRLDRVGVRTESSGKPACISSKYGHFYLDHNSEFSVGKERANKFEKAGRKVQFG